MALYLQSFIEGTSDVEDIATYTRKKDSLKIFHEEFKKLPYETKWTYLHDLLCSSYNIFTKWYKTELEDCAKNGDEYVRSSAQELLDYYHEGFSKV